MHTRGTQRETERRKWKVSQEHHGNHGGCAGYQAVAPHFRPAVCALLVKQAIFLLRPLASAACWDVSMEMLEGDLNLEEQQLVPVSSLFLHSWNLVCLPAQRYQCRLAGSSQSEIWVPALWGPSCKHLRHHHQSGTTVYLRMTSHALLPRTPLVLARKDTRKSMSQRIFFPEAWFGHICSSWVLLLLSAFSLAPGDPDAGKDWRREERGDNRGWDGWMASLTQWTWVWVNSGSWWWAGKPGVLQSMGSQRVGHDWETELNWTEEWWVLPETAQIFLLPF